MIPVAYLSVFGTRVEREIGDKRRSWTAAARTVPALVNHSMMEDDEVFGRIRGDGLLLILYFTHEEALMTNNVAGDKHNVFGFKTLSNSLLLVE